MLFLLQIMLAAGGFYAAFGVVFALAFVTVGVKSVDPGAKNGSWGFRLLILPGVAMFWPVLLYRWKSGRHESPIERNAHRQNATRSEAK
jgi:hypothetical protein